jgi:hypothetical protein
MSTADRVLATKKGFYLSLAIAQSPQIKGTHGAARLEANRLAC